MKLSDVIEKQGFIFHFNVSTFEQIRAFCDISKELGIYIILGASEGERKYLGSDFLKKVVDFEKEKGAKIFLNADHCKSLKSAEEAVNLGYDSITFDLSNLSFEENKNLTKEFVNWAKKMKEDIFIEGELGNIKGRSEVFEEKIEINEEDLTNPELAEIFVKETNVDSLAVSVGNLHGISTVSLAKIDIERIKEIKKRTNKFLTLHGGSGIEYSKIKEAIENGINIIHINTELRLCWRSSLENSLNQNPGTVTPYVILNDVILNLKIKTREILSYFY
jgi:fructose-bisphosphate aldolase class II